MVEIVDSWQLLHLVDGDRPADEDCYNYERVEPMIVPVEFLLDGIDGLFVRLQLGLIDGSLHCLYVLVLHNVFLVNFTVDEVAYQEGNGNGDGKCNQS